MVQGSAMRRSIVMRSRIVRGVVSMLVLLGFAALGIWAVEQAHAQPDGIAAVAHLTGQ